MILEQLAEKKDLLIYAKFRAKHLAKQMKCLAKLENPKDRQKAILRVDGRIRELEMLKKVIAEGRLKKLAKRFWDESERKS